jgi:hypothetical protein
VIFQRTFGDIEWDQDSKWFKKRAKPRNNKPNPERHRRNRCIDEVSKRK